LLGRRLTAVDPAGNAITYTYDALGQRATMTAPNGGVFTYAYGARGQIAHLVNPQGDRTTFSYDAGGRRMLTELANGTRASYTYDGASRVTELYNLKADDSVILGLTYEHDSVGNPIAMLESSGDRVTWTYDATDQLTREQRSGAVGYDTTYAYDSLGNRLLKEASAALTTYAYDLANQLTTSQDASGVTTYTYDLAGNLRIVEQPTGQRTTTTWDDQNRQTRVLLPAGGIVTSAYRFDGLRHEKAEPQRVTKYIWDFQNYLAETDLADTVEAVYTNEPQQYGNLISQYRKGPTIWVPSYYQYDALGTTRGLTDESGGATDTYVYDAWGSHVDVSGTTVNSFRWIGKVGYYWDQGTGTFYIRARVYEPVIGRWMSQDPLWYPLVISSSSVKRTSISVFRLIINLYRYVLLRPLGLIDPSGLDQVSPGAPPAGVIAPAGKKCGITMMNKTSPFPDPGFAGRLDVPPLYGAKTEQEILKYIRDNKCCSVWMFGHRGGIENPGGIITYGPNGQRIVLLPGSFGENLAAAFADNECDYCTINLYTCQTGTADVAPGIRKEIAESTGCVVCGTRSGWATALEPGLEPCTKCDPGWVYSCELPPKGWGRDPRQCIRREYVLQGVAPYAGFVWVCAEYQPVPVLGPPVPPHYP
jgi:RHS repeat-associated protein